MGRRIGRVLVVALSALLLGSATPIPQSDAANPRPTTKRSYPTRAELLPIRAALGGIREAIVYRIDWHLVTPGYDSVGIVAGYPVLQSAPVDQSGHWLDSLSAILTDPTSYL